jgi:hypothetical protein
MQLDLRVARLGRLDAPLPKTSLPPSRSASSVSICAFFSNTDNNVRSNVCGLGNTLPDSFGISSPF